MKDKYKKPQGRKATLPVRPATYHNWFTPFAWLQIEIAVRQVGWKMGASEIVAAAKQINPIAFGGLSRTTVKSWIDRSGDTPKWTTAVLQRINRGNDTGHNKGGQRGVLVGVSIRESVAYLTEDPFTGSLITRTSSKRSRIVSLKCVKQGPP